MNKSFYPYNLINKPGTFPLFATDWNGFSKFTDASVELNNYYDIIFSMDKLISIYINAYKPAGNSYGIHAVDGNNIYMGKDINIIGRTIINDTLGPVILSDKCKLNGFNLIEGPAYIGESTLLDNATIRGPFICGKVCKLSGEIEESFLMNYVNKHHYGFIGHSIIENWVNLGAGTTNSDLKNNYSSIRMFDGEKFSDTKHVKLGCIIGEHSKTAIGTMINTGTVIGPFSNVFGNMLRVKHLKPFSWGTENHFVQLNKLIDLIYIVMERRGENPEAEYIEKIKKLYENTISE